MDIERAIEYLRAERERVQAAIEALEATVSVRRRAAGPVPRKQNRVSNEARERASERMKLYWEKRKSAGTAAGPEDQGAI